MCQPSLDTPSRWRSTLAGNIGKRPRRYRTVTVPPCHEIPGLDWGGVSLPKSSALEKTSCELPAVSRLLNNRVSNNSLPVTSTPVLPRRVMATITFPP